MLRIRAVSWRYGFPRHVETKYLVAVVWRYLTKLRIATSPGHCLLVYLVPFNSYVTHSELQRG
jgi:hypothetical protein